MGRNQTTGQRVNPTGPITSTFGRGEVQFFLTTTTWTIPAGVTAVRARVWGGGANKYRVTGGGKTPSVTRAGAGGGFAIKVVTGLTPGGTVTVTVPASTNTNGAAGGTCSFGAHVSATGGSASSSSAVGGAGSGGDLNYTGGSSNPDDTITGTGGGGVANLFGNGGQGRNGSSSAVIAPGASGGGGAYGAVNNEGGSGPFGRGGFQDLKSVGTGGGILSVLPETGNLTGSLDFIGCGGGGAGAVSSDGPAQSGVNGGGGGGFGVTSSFPTGRGGFPGGGQGSSATNVMYSSGTSGLVVVEW